MSDEQKKQAISNATAAYNARVRFEQYLDQQGTKKSFSRIGNDQCMARTEQAIEEMKNDTASTRRWNYWLKQGN